MFSSLTQWSAMLAAAVCLVGISGSLLNADVPADYKGKPWKGKMQTLPGKLTCAFFDEGGEGVGYHNKDTKNHGSGELNRGPEEKNNFRKDEGISISYTKAAFDKFKGDKKFKDGELLPLDQYYVGWTAQGEWLNYTVDVQKAGTYTINILATSYQNKDEVLSLSVNGVKKCEFKLEETGDYHNWRMLNNVGEITLEKGTQLLKLTIEKQQHASNLQYVEFVEKPAAEKDAPK